MKICKTAVTNKQKLLKSHDVYTHAYMHTPTHKTFKLKSQGRNFE